MAVFVFVEALASFADGVADADADCTGVGFDVATIDSGAIGTTGGRNLLLIHTKYPAITTSTNIIITIVMFLFIWLYLNPFVSKDQY